MACSRPRWIVIGLILAYGVVGGEAIWAQNRATPLFGPMLKADTVMAGSFDSGRLWSFSRIPTDHFQSRYSVRPDEEWQERARLGVVRLPGCTGALVSERGLVLTSAECVRTLRSEGGGADSLEEESFLARTPNEERPLPDAYAERVVGLTDVTEDVQAVRDSMRSDSLTFDDQTPAQRAIDRVQQRRQRDADDTIRIEVVRDGTRFTAYRYRRFEDVRLAFLPERGVSQFGGVENAFSYPRHDWAGALVRIYESSGPIDSPKHLSVRTQGARPGDTVFALGFPERGHRTETAEQVRGRAEISVPAEQRVLDTWIRAVADLDGASEGTTYWNAQLQDGQIRRRKNEIWLDAVGSEYIRDRLRMRDSAFVANGKSATVPVPRRRALLDSVQALQDEKRKHERQRRVFALFGHPTYSSASLRRAWAVYERDETEQMDPGSLREPLRSIRSQPRPLDAALLSARIERAMSLLEVSVDGFHSDSLLSVTSLRARIDSSVFRTSDATVAALENGGVPTDDPLMRLVQPVLEAYDSFRSETADVRQKEERLTDQLAHLRAKTSSLPLVHSGNQVLRLADGVIRGYPANGTVTPPFTTFFGLYGQSESFSADSEWGLPSSWRGPRENLALSTPLALAASTDVGGGLQGGAVVNSFLHVVGIVTGQNDRSVLGESIFLRERMRAVALDVRGVLEGLRTVYGADRLAAELTGSEEGGERSPSTSLK